MTSGGGYVIIEDVKNKKVINQNKMTKQAKMITAVVAAVVVVAGGLGLYLKGGDLMGRMNLKRLPAYDKTVSQSSCPSAPELVYASGYPTSGESSEVDTYGELYNLIKGELAQNGGETNCPYAIYFDGADDNGDSYVADGVTKCGVGDMKAIMNEIQCAQQVGDIGVYTSISDSGASLYYSYVTLGLASEHQLRINSLSYAVYRESN